MPPRKTTATRAKTTKSSRKGETASPAERQEICDGCLATISKDDLLVCSVCGVKLHRYCVGIPRSHYARVSTAFVCIVCRKLMTPHKPELRREIAALKTQMSELRAALADNTSSMGVLKEDVAKPKKPPLATNFTQNRRTYAAATAANSRGRQNRRSGNTRQGCVQGRGTNAATRPGSSPPNGVQLTTSGPGTTESEGSNDRAKVQVKGARKIWGTMAESTVRSVKNAINRFCNVAPSGLSVRCKDRVIAATNKSVWWYIVHTDEKVLCDLESKWESIELQLDWKLEQCYMNKATGDPQSSAQVASQSKPQAQSSMNADDTQSDANAVNLQTQPQAQKEESNADTESSTTSDPNLESGTVDNFLVEGVVSHIQT